VRIGPKSSVGFVGPAADEDLERRIVGGLEKDRLVPTEGGLVDDRAHEVAPVADIAHRQRRGRIGQPVAHPEVPEAVRHVRPGRRRALLALVLERAADQCGDDGCRICGPMHRDEVFSAGLADDARESDVAIDLATDRPP